MVVVLKSLEHALRDHDHIYATVNDIRLKLKNYRS